MKLATVVRYKLSLVSHIDEKNGEDGGVDLQSGRQGRREKLCRAVMSLGRVKAFVSFTPSPDRFTARS